MILFENSDVYYMNKKNAAVIITILICLNIGFIWGNSAQVGEVSNAVSDKVADAIKPVAEPIIKPIAADDGTVFGIQYDSFIRKTAHALEFMALGILLAARRRISRKPQVGTMLFIALATAVTDEAIQILSARTDSVKDILIDFAGAVAGMLIAGGVMFVVRTIAGYQHRRKKSR